MTSLRRFLYLTLTTLLCVSAFAQAQDNRYYNIQQATHISDGWIGYSNGELYHCQLAEDAKVDKASCLKATGLPTSLHSIELLSANGNQAWVSYSNGNIYGCQTVTTGAAHCVQAAGLP